MPLYEYSCPLCGSFEVLQKADDKPLNCDPDCKHKDCPRSATRRVSAAAFHLKGGGWYKTDYASGGSSSGPKNAGNKGDTSSTESKSEKKSTELSGGESKTTKKDGGSGGGCGPGCGCH